MSLFFPKDGDQPMLRLGPVVRKPAATTPLGTEVATGTPGIYEAPDGKLFTRLPENERARPWYDPKRFGFDGKFVSVATLGRKIAGRRADFVTLDDIDYSDIELRAATMSQRDWYTKMCLDQTQAKMPAARSLAMKEAHAQSYGTDQNVHDSIYGSAEVTAAPSQRIIGVGDTYTAAEYDAGVVYVPHWAYIECNLDTGVRTRTL